MSRLFILKPFSNDRTRRIWGRDSLHGIIVRAGDETEARHLAAKSAGDEKGFFDKDHNPWLDSKVTICSELQQDGDQGVVLTDYWTR